MQCQAALLGELYDAHRWRYVLGDHYQCPLVARVQSCWRGHCGQQRQIDMKGAAATWLALQLHPTVVEYHQSPRNAEPQADPLVSPRSGMDTDERLEDLLLQLARDARSCVGDPQVQLRRYNSGAE